MTNTTTFTSIEEMNDFLFTAVKKASVKYTYGTHINADDMESYVMIRTWNYISKNEEYQTKKGIQQRIKSYVLDFLKSPVQNSDSLTFSSLSSSDDEGSESDFESTYESTNQVNIADTVTEGTLLTDFLATLTDRQRVIVELRSGILSSLSASEMTTAKEIMDKQSSKKTGEVYLSNTDIAKIIGIGRAKVQNHIARISELALDFGLED